MSTLAEHEAEQAAITAMCEAGECDHPECHEDDARRHPTRADLMREPEWDYLLTDDSGNPCVWENCYHCYNGHATEHWNDEHSRQCDDDCPVCGTAVSPEDSIWIGPAGQEQRWADLPEAE